METETSNPTDTLLGGIPDPSEFADSIPVPPEALNISPPADAGGEPQSPPVTSPHGSEVAPASVIEDGSDDVFNSDIHAGGPDGKGIRTKSGKFRRKPGRKKAAGEPGTINTPGVVTQGDIIDPNRMNKAKAAAQVCTAATFILGQVICGAEGAPLVVPEHGINEPAEFESAYTQAFYMSENPIDVPPWVLIAIVAGSYTARRMAMPNTRSRIGRVWGWIKLQTIRVYLWYKGK